MSPEEKYKKTYWHRRLNMKKIIIITCLSAFVFAGLSAQNRTAPAKQKSLMENNRTKSVVKTTSTFNTDLIELESEAIVTVPEEPKSVNDYTNETHFRGAYDKVLNEYLNEYAASNKKYVEANSAIDAAAALSIAKIQSTNYSECWSPTEIDFKKQELRENLQRNVEDLRVGTLNRIQAEYNQNIALIDQKKTELDSAIASTEFIIKDVEVCFSPYDNVSKTWLCKVTSVNPEVKFVTDWLSVKLDYESLEAQYETLAPKIKAGVRAEAHYVVDVLKYDDDPEDMTTYSRKITAIELLDSDGKRIAFFDNLDIPAGSWDWKSYRKQVFVNGSASVAMK